MSCAGRRWAALGLAAPIRTRSRFEPGGQLGNPRVRRASPAPCLNKTTDIRGPGDGALVAIGGLADGATLSAGQPAGDHSWRLSAANLKDVTLQPPRDFVGDLTIELRLADDTVADRRCCNCILYSNVPYRRRRPLSSNARGCGRKKSTTRNPLWFKRRVFQKASVALAPGMLPATNRAA
jgi:hypothetical protein